MNDRPAVHDDEPLPTFTSDELDAMVLDFHRLTAKLARARLITVAASARLMRAILREKRNAEAHRAALSELVLDILLGIEEGTLKEGEHFMRLPDDRLALHPESVANALYKAGRGKLLRREVKALLLTGWQQYRHVVVDRTSRARFNGDGDRRRVVVLHEPTAYEFVGAHKKAVPFR